MTRQHPMKIRALFNFCHRRARFRLNLVAFLLVTSPVRTEHKATPVERWTNGHGGTHGWTTTVDTCRGGHHILILVTSVTTYPAPVRSTEGRTLQTDMIQTYSGAADRHRCGVGGTQYIGTAGYWQRATDKSRLIPGTAMTVAKCCHASEKGALYLYDFDKRV